MRTWRLSLAMMLLAGLTAYAGDEEKKTWTFDKDTPGAAPKGFSPAVGDWSVVTTEEGNVLAQTASSANPVFNVVLVDDTNAKDVDLTVKIKAIAGERDQGGGLVWRAADAKNYYLARYNPLEDNYRLYRVVGGKRTLIQNVDIAHTDGWHTLRVTMTGDQITCYYDGKKSLEAKDSTLPEAGKLGLWSKADAQSQFDDLTLITP